MTTKNTDSWQGGGRIARVITHVAFEDLGSFGQILRESGFELAYLNAASDEAAFLIIAGTARSMGIEVEG